MRRYPLGGVVVEIRPPSISLRWLLVASLAFLLYVVSLSLICFIRGSFHHLVSVWLCVWIYL